MSDSANRFCVAPMMDWTDRHCRYFHRLLSQHARLYTEMVHTGAILYGDTARHLRFDPAEHQLALQLGGAEPADLARCAEIAERHGYDEVNLNCGCPSDRVQEGRFGACLMREPGRVADSVRAMRAATRLPVTVKCRIGIDDSEEYAFLRSFVEAVAAAGCKTFIVHARKAWLQGLSPKENREIPPLRYELAHRLKQDFPHLTIAVNGGITTNEQIAEHLQHVDGVMLGREAYHHPWLLTTWDEAFFGAAPSAVTREWVEEQMVDYMERAHAEDGCPWYAIARHMLGLRHGLRGARKWRQVWSDHRLKPLPPREVWQMARMHVSDEPEALTA
jgi:tRNA-dihydrouridine synthase A